MVNGPPCRQCGSPLRWFPEQNAWGCDRCRQMFPAQMTAPPQQQQQPQQQQAPMQGQQMPQMPGQQPPRQAGPGGGSKQKLVIGGLVAVAAIVVIAIVATRGGKKSSDPNEAVLTQLEQFRDEICACTDEPCRKQVLQRMSDARDADTSSQKMNHEQSERMSKIFKEMGKCVPGVSGGDDSGGGGDDDVVSRIEQAREDMCNCMSASCAQGESSKLLKWMKAHKAALDALSDDVRSKTIGIMKEQKACYDRLMKDE
jgi:hypothetical protein